MAKKRIGSALRQARLQAGLSMRDLERRCGLSTGEISQIETGRRVDPGFSVVLRVARGIGISLDDLAARLEDGGAPTVPAGAKKAAKAQAAFEKAADQYRRLGAALDRIADAFGEPRAKK